MEVGLVEEEDGAGDVEDEEVSEGVDEEGEPVVIVELLADHGVEVSDLEDDGGDAGLASVQVVFEPFEKSRVQQEE